MPEKDPSIVAQDVSVTYRVYADQRPSLRKLVARGGRGREYRAVEAVQRVSFLAHPGEAVGIVGHNGSGKSSLLRALAGLIPASEGRVWARSLPVLLGVGAAFQPEISGRRNVFLGGTALGISRSRLEDEFDEIVTFAGLEDFIDMPLRAYSSGMAARLQFAVATASTPDILMIDEALAVGDEEFRRRSEARIASMIDSAGTVFLVSHNLGTVRDTCSRTLWLDHGVLKLNGPTDEVVDAYLASTRDPGASD